MVIIYGRADSEKQLLDLYPKQVKKIEDIDLVHQKLKAELNAEGDGFLAGFRKWRKKRQISKFEENKNDTFHAGASGELLALRKLSELSNDFHVMCGVNAVLPYFVTYRGKKNLGSAQLDFIVISKKGIILIEVKNWSTQFYEQHDKISPHEQVDRAGRVLWIVIKSRWGWLKKEYPRVTSVLVSIQGNMKYDLNYKFVNVLDLDRINYFIENRKDELSEKEVKKLVNILKKHVTK